MIYNHESAGIYLGTAGSERLRITATGNVNQTIGADAIGFNQTAAGNHYVKNVVNANRSGAGAGILAFHGQWNSKDVASIKFRTGADTTNKDDGHICFETSSANNITERLRINSDGKVLIGHTASESLFYTGSIQVQGTNSSTSGITVKSNQNDSGGPAIVLGKSRSGSVGGNTVVQDGDEFGCIYFNGADGTDTVSQGAFIRGSCDGTPGSNDMPGRLVFGTTADGAATATERLRIGSAGQLGIAGANYGTSGQVLTSAGSGSAIAWATPSSGGYTLISTTTLSGGTTTLSSLNFSAYVKIEALIYGATVGSGSVGDFYIRFNSDSGNNYRYVVQRMDNNGSTSEVGVQAASAFFINMTGVAGYTSGFNWAHFEVHNNNISTKKLFRMNSGGLLTTSGAGPIVLNTCGWWDNSNAITTIDIKSSSTLTGGTIKLYGVK